MAKSSPESSVSADKGKTKFEPKGEPKTQQKSEQKKQADASPMPSDPREIYYLMVSEKRKRDDANALVREAITDLRLFREERDRINKEIAGLKEQRNESRNQGRQMIKEAKALREMLNGFDAPKGSSDSLGRLIEELDFKYQTNPVPFEEEKRLVKKIEELKKLWKAKKFVEKKTASISSISGKVDDFFEQSDTLHQQILEKAKKSEELHNLYIQKVREIDPLRKKSNAAHEKVLLYAKALGDARELEAEERVQRKAEGLLEQERRLKERADAIREKVESKIAAQSGKKTFNLRDLQILSAASGDGFSIESLSAGKDESE